MTQTVLAIDDSPEIHQLLKVRLKNLDVELSHADCGFDGFDLALAGNPDLILLDVMMPDASGFDICRKLKATTETRNIPVIFLTGASDVDQKVLGFDVGAVDYIQKPFDSAELSARVRAALRTKRFQDMLAQRAMIDGLTGLWNRAHFDQRMHEEGAAAARSCAISLLAQVKVAMGGDLDRLVRVVKLTGFVNSTPDFADQPKVINGCSDFLVEALGDKGPHARAAVSAGALPLNVAVEIEGIFQVK